MPLLFLGHGNTMNAIKDSIFVDGFKKVAQQMEKPKSILCISAHWYIKGTKVTGMPFPRTIHDFGGFPQELYQVQYPAPSNPELAEQVIELIPDVPIELDYDWGLDHGTWSVIIIHNLRAVDYDNMDEIDYGNKWAIQAHDEINNLIIHKKYDKLIDYKNGSQEIQFSIPSPDHFLPLLYILGLQQENEKVTLFNDHLVGGSLSMTSLIIS